MPIHPQYTIGELASIAGVTPRTIRYYISVGLLPSPGQAGANTRYGEDILRRVRLIRQLQDQHLPLAEIRSHIESMGDADVAAAVDASHGVAEVSSALDYIRSLHHPPAPLARAAPRASSRAPMPTPSPAPPIPANTGASAQEPPMATRTTWERIALGPDIELHVRRPLGRLDNKRVERLITIAREMFEEDQP